LIGKTGPLANLVNSGKISVLNNSLTNALIISQTSNAITAFINPVSSINIIDFENNDTAIFSYTPNSMTILSPSISNSGVFEDTITIQIQIADTSAKFTLRIANKNNSSLAALLDKTTAVQSLNTFQSVIDYEAGLNTVREIENITSLIKSIKIIYTLPAVYKKRTINIYSYNEGFYEWEPIYNDSSNIKFFNDTASVELQHFSIYGLFIKGLAPKQNLNSIVVFPNPFRPNDGDNRTGIEFSGSYNIDNPTGIHIKGLTEQSTVSIYTLSGALINTIRPINGTSMAIWNAKNLKGEFVASGIYLVLVKDNSGNKVEKLMIIR